MELIIRKQPIIQCGKCGKSISISNDSQIAGWDEISRDNDRPQGIAFTYQSEPIDIECPYCKNKIEYQIEVTEYPEETKEDFDIDITGGTVLENPQIDIE